MKKILLGIVAVPVVLLLGAAVYVHFTTWSNHAAVMRRLNAADPKELLAACRTVMTNYPSYRHDPNWGKKVNIPDPTDPKMPEVIRKLHPRGVIVHIAEPYRIDDCDYVNIYWGRDALVTALPEVKTPAGRSFPGKKIIEGLYYAEANGVY